MKRFNPTIVYRVQDSEGSGPFKPGFTRLWSVERNAIEQAALSAMPSDVIRKVIIARQQAFVGFACLSIAHLQRWFYPQEYRALLTYGYDAVRLEVDAIIATAPIQCAFIRTRPLTVSAIAFDLHAPGSASQVAQQQILTTP